MLTQQVAQCHVTILRLARNGAKVCRVRIMALHIVIQYAVGILVLVRPTPLPPMTDIL